MLLLFFTARSGQTQGVGQSACELELFYKNNFPQGSYEITCWAWKLPLQATMQVKWSLFDGTADVLTVCSRSMCLQTKQTSLFWTAGQWMVQLLSWVEH